MQWDYGLSRGRQFVNTMSSSGNVSVLEDIGHENQQSEELGNQKNGHKEVRKLYACGHDLGIAILNQLEKWEVKLVGTSGEEHIRWQCAVCSVEMGRNGMDEYVMIIEEREGGRICCHCHCHCHWC